LPQVEINIAYPSRRHLPAKVRSFIDHLVDHFSQTPNSLLGEQWIKDGLEPLPLSSMHDAGATLVPPEAFDGAEPLASLLEGERDLGPQQPVAVHHRVRGPLPSRIVR
jgi:hypothetical protein